MRTFGENLTSALRSLRGSCLRTALTMLGVVIGVGSVALLVSIGQGVKKEVTEQVQGLGANLVFERLARYILHAPLFPGKNHLRPFDSNHRLCIQKE